MFRSIPRIRSSKIRHLALPSVISSQHFLAVFVDPGAGEWIC
jgi:hypothetical protein